MLCPDAMTLKRLLLGQLPAGDAEFLSRHLEECDRCVAAVQTLRPEDTFTEAARAVDRDAGAVDAQVDVDAGVIDGLVERFSEMLTSAGPATFLLHESGQNRRLNQSELEGILSPAETPGELGRLGPYRILKVLGAGGMGVVCEAEDPVLKRRVALKTLQPIIAASPAARERFLREARAVAAVEDERIVAIHHVGEESGIPFFVMPLLRGQTLEDRLRAVEKETGRRTLPAAEALHIACEAARGLASAHARGLIHRDVKPGNIFLVNDSVANDKPTNHAEFPVRAPDVMPGIKLLDFGLARALDEALSLTNPGSVAGTPAYMAPEQLGGGATDERCDLYALGCVLYRMLTGQTPWPAAERLTGAAVGSPITPADLNPAVPAELAAFTLELLGHDPARRPPSAVAVVKHLEQIAGELSSVSIAPRKKPQRRALAWAFAAAAILVAAATVMMLVRTGRGEFVIETDDPDVAVMIAKTGGITLHDRKTNQTYTLTIGKHDLPTGEYEIDVRDAAGLRFSARQFTIKRQDRTAVTVSLQPRRLGAFEAWLADVTKLPAEKQVAAVGAKLRERNPDFDGTLGPRIEDGNVVEVQLFTDHITDLSPLGALADLEMLTCRGSASGQGRVMDLTPLKNLKNLVYLDISANRVSDLGPLHTLKLRDLSCWANPIQELRPLRGMPLRSLQLDSTFVTDADLGPLEDLPLKKLYLRVSYANDLQALAGIPLEELHCHFRPERHPRTLRRIKTLQTINGTPADKFWEAHEARRAALERWTPRVADLQPADQLKEVTAKLSELNPGFNAKLYDKVVDGHVEELRFFSTDVTDLAPLAVFSKLKSLFIGGATPARGRVHDLDPLRTLPLEILNVGQTEVADLSPLAEIKTLSALICRDTFVRDLTPLRKMSLRVLDCSGSRVQDIAPLRGASVTRLYLKGCRIADLSPLSGMRLVLIDGDFQPDRHGKLLRAISTLEIINDKPAAEFLRQLDAQ
jgi:eukaryotic-like serine/threonine-protein kinase